MDISTVTQTLAQASQFVSYWWPWDAPTTLHMVAEVAGLIYAGWGLKDWTKVKSFITDKCKEAEGLTLSNPEKLELVVAQVWKLVPAKLKMLPWINEDMIRALIVSQYKNVVKPQIKSLQSAAPEPTTDAAPAQVETTPDNPPVSI